MALNPSVQYVKKAPPKATPKNPTLSQLLQSESDKDKVLYRIPMVSRIGPPVRLDKILLNKQIFEPGEELFIHKDIAAELEVAVANHEQAILKQMTGNQADNRFIEQERETQRAFEVRRLAREAGMSAGPERPQEVA